MALKLRILRSLTRLFIILVSLTRLLFSEKLLISNRCISGLMSDLIKKSWTVLLLSLNYFLALGLSVSSLFGQNSSVQYMLLCPNDPISSQILFIKENSQVFFYYVTCQLWIVNYYIISQSNNLSNENINTDVSVVFKTKYESKCQNELFY